MPKIEVVYELAEKNAGMDDELDFFGAARELGFSVDDSEEMESELTVRLMRARGAI